MPHTRFPFRAAIPVILALGTGISMADEEPAAAAAPVFRSPGDLTAEERAAMMARVSEYNGCVYKEAMARVEKTPDIRQAADAAMGACKGVTDELRALIAGYGFEPGFAELFSHHAESRAVRNLLPELALRKGNP